MVCSSETSRARKVTITCLVCVLLSAPNAARAQSTTKQGAAQALFDEARALFERGSYDVACDKFRASNELDPKGGTLLNLAICREKQGWIASAWTAYAEAKNLSSKEGREERVAFAENKLRELERNVPRLRIIVDEKARVAGLVVKVDGEPLPAAAWNTSVPIDPGPRRIEANAPGYAPFSEAHVAKLGRAEDVRVRLVRDTSPALAETPPSTTSSTKPVGWTVAALGAASIGVGSIFGVRAFDRRSDAESLCRAGRCDEGRALNDDGKSDAWVSNVTIGVGALALAAGLYLIFQSPRPSAK